MKTSSSSAPTPGKIKKRRTPPRKNEIVLAAAEQAFIESGYTATSVDAIAERAGVSKRTVYSNFATKQTLYGEVVKKLCEEVVPMEIDPKALEADPEKTLLKVAVSFLEGLYQPRQVAWHRAVVADSRVHPDAGRMVFEGPVMRSEAVFDHYFRKQTQRGVMQFPNIELAAAQFLGILKTNLHLRLTLSEPEVIPHREIEDIARASVHLFLYGALKRNRATKK
jgi:TetR/AcrR family transcriptional regulator, mexJK operon transcriptional repressor